MASKLPIRTETVDELLKALLVLSRTTDRVLTSGLANDVADEPLSLTKIQILRLLGNRGSRTSSQIARFLGVSKPAVTQVMDAMVRGNLILRTHAVDDRREIHLRLTDQGKITFQKIRKRQRHLARSAVRQLELRDLDGWIETLQQVAVAIAKADKAFEHFCMQCGAHANGTCVLEGGEANCKFLAAQVQTTRGRSRMKSRSGRSRPA